MWVASLSDGGFLPVYEKSQIWLLLELGYLTAVNADGESIAGNCG